LQSLITSSNFTTFHRVGSGFGPVHGATHPAETIFHLALGGRSMMDHIAQQGWDVYLVANS
jgi:hypothetical protein